FGHSIRGATHRRNSLPNQDALGLLNADGGDGPIVVAVADGHGSSRCPRSHVGSRLAVNAAVHVVASALSHRKAPDCGMAARELIKEWRKAVAEHLAEHRFNEVS